MFRLDSMAQARLSPEACAVAETFLAALPPSARRQLRAIRLFGPQARRFEPEAPFDLLVMADMRSIEVKTALAVGAAAIEADGLYLAAVTVTTPTEAEQPAPMLARLLRNAQREGIDLWVREPAALAVG